MYKTKIRKITKSIKQYIDSPVELPYEQHEQKHTYSTVITL